MQDILARIEVQNVILHNEESSISQRKIAGMYLEVLHKNLQILDSTYEGNLVERVYPSDLFLAP